MGNTGMPPLQISTPAVRTRAPTGPRLRPAMTHQQARMVCSMLMVVLARVTAIPVLFTRMTLLAAWVSACQPHSL
jgi:hypothetical protein